MIYTKDNANMFFVYLTAYRSHETKEVNELFTEGMAKHIARHSAHYGVLVLEDIEGCYRETGSNAVSIERTLMVRCTSESQVAELADLACYRYDQDSILVVRSQTRTSELWSVKDGVTLTKTRLDGQFQKVDKPTGECYSKDGTGQYWEVI